MRNSVQLALTWLSLRVLFFCLACWEQVTFAEKERLLEAGVELAGQSRYVEASSSPEGARGLCVCFIFILQILLFIYFWLCQVFVAVRASPWLQRAGLTFWLRCGSSRCLLLLKSTDPRVYWV